MKKLLIIVLFILIASQSWAANYNVTWDGDGRTDVDGDTFCSGTCQPDDTITLPSGTTNDGLLLRDLHGSAGHPIIIRNTSAAQTIIDMNDNEPSGTGSGDGFRVISCSYIKIDGSNGYTTSSLDLEDPGSYTFGIRITDCMRSGILAFSGSEEIEIQYVEIDDIFTSGTTYGAGGIGIKENSTIGVGVSEYDTLSGIYIHHNYVHDTGNAGLYIGKTESCTTVDCCNSVNDSDDAVSWSNAEIHHNRTDDTGRDGISAGCAEDYLIYNNIVTDAGLGDYSGVGQGGCYCLNRGIGGSFYNNIAINCEKQGVTFFGSGELDIYSNVVVNAGLMEDAGEGVGIDDTGHDDSAAVTIRYNTIISPYEYAIGYSASQTGLVQDNLWVDITGSNDYGSATATNPGVGKTTVAECYFESPGSPNYNYDLTSSTPGDIVSAGQSSGYPTTDIEGVVRPSGAQDIGAYEYTSGGSIRRVNILLGHF